MFKAIFCITIVFILISSCTPGNNKQIIEDIGEEKIVTNFDRGKIFLSQKKFDLAIIELDSALQINPNVAVIYRYRGMAKAGKGNYSSAINDLETAIELNPADLSSLYEKGNIEFEANMLDVAITDYSYVIEKDSLFDDAYLNRGLAKLRKGVVEDACKDFYLARVYGNKHAEQLIKENCKSQR